MRREISSPRPLREGALHRKWSGLALVIPAKETVDFLAHTPFETLTKARCSSGRTVKPSNLQDVFPFALRSASVFASVSKGAAGCLSTLSKAGIQAREGTPPHLDTRFRGYDGFVPAGSPTAPTLRANLSAGALHINPQRSIRRRRGGTPTPERISSFWRRAALSPLCLRTLCANLSEGEEPPTGSCATA